MTRDDIIRMAREVGFVANVSEEHWGEVPYAKLCHPTPTSTALFKMLERFFHMAQAAEREACAKVLDEMADQMVADMEPSPAINWVRNRAAAIRARGEK